jgi:hypothetical protein
MIEMRKPVQEGLIERLRAIGRLTKQMALRSEFQFLLSAL